MTTWSPTNKTSGIVLSGGDLIATQSGSGRHFVMSSAAIPSGLSYCEVNVLTNAVTDATVIGIALSIPSGFLGEGSSGFGAYYEGTDPAYTYAEFGFDNSWPSTLQLGAGNTVGVAIDWPNKKLWLRSRATSGGTFTGWHDFTSNARNPATNDGGVNFSGMSSGTTYLIVGTAASGDGMSVNFGASAFLGTPPSGFSGWDSGGGSTAYTLTAAQGSYALTGQSANLPYGRTMAAAQGAYTQTGVAANLVRGRTIVAAQGSYALTGVAANLTPARTMAAAQGSYTLTGVSANLNYSAGAQSYTLTAAQGSYSLTGVDAAFPYGRLLAAAQGAYTLTGQAATLLYSAGSANYTLTAALGAYTLTGVSAGLSSARIMPAAVGSYALTGVAASLNAARQMAAAQGSYALSGQDAAFNRGLTLSAAQGSYAYTGQDATLSLVSGAAYTLTAAQGAYTVSGQAAAFHVALSMAAARGSYALSGKAAELLWSGEAPVTPTAKVPREILVPGLNDKNPARVNTAIRQIVERLGDYAKLDSPILSGDPEAPTPDLGDNSESIATTAFVKGQGYATIAYVDSENDAQDTVIAGKANAVHTHAIADVTNLQTSLDGKEPVIAAGTSTQYWRGDKTWATISQKLVDIAYAEYSTYTSVTSIIPYDNTVPQSTEGTQILSVTVTTTSATQKVRLFSTVNGYVFSGSNFVAALFQGTTCIHAAPCFLAGEIGIVVNQIEVTPGAAGSYTFSVRVGGGAAGTTYLNGTNSSQLFGGVSKCVLSAQVFEP